jgi:hypothetical protein
MGLFSCLVDFVYVVVSCLVLAVCCFGLFLCVDV